MVSIYRIFSLLLVLQCCFNFTVCGQDLPSSSNPLQRSVELTLTSPDTAVFYALQAIVKSQEAGDNQELMKAYHQLGYIYYNQNKFDEAEKYFINSSRIAKSDNYPDGLALAYNRLGNVNQLTTNYLKALDFYTKALTLNKTQDNKPEIARTLVNLANVYGVIGQYQRSIEYFLEAMNTHESSGDKDGLGWTSLGIARLFKKLDLLDRAMQYAENALRYYQEVLKESGNSIGVTLSLNEIGSIYHKLGDFPKALEYTNRVLDINRSNNNLHGQSANYLSLGVIYLDMHQNQFAKVNLSKALVLKEQVADSIDIAPLYRYLGQIEMEEGRLDAANIYFAQSLSFAKQHRLLPDISEAYLSLSQVYSKQDNYRRSLDTYINHIAYKDSLNSNDISRLEMQYEFEKREKEQELMAKQREALQEARLDRQRVVLIFFVVAFLLAGALAGFIFYNYREKKRINFVLLEQNNEISRQNREIESQKEEIEQQRDFVTKQRDQIAEQQRQITDSITYASRIQSAVLPGEMMLEKLSWESFVFYKPKNIVSGDFYWATKLMNGNVLLAAADCTGHGVPGAFMSMLGITLLREISSRPEILSPADMLTKLREMVIMSLNQQGGKVDQADGMDMTIVIINPNTLEMEFAGAYLSAIVVRQGNFNVSAESQNPRVSQQNGISLLELRGNKMPIGHHLFVSEPFTNLSLQLNKGDMLYLFSDGYADQFGGERNIKFLLQNFRTLLMDICALDINEQKETLVKTIEEYQGDKKQVDDMLVLGVRLS
ncbi:MAG: tetratricopeptide repeat protein [Bacteroidales bacterium]|nr:tetratricopeptide repeat protein [Bacteroidales bacterium]